MRDIDKLPARWRNQLKAEAESLRAQAKAMSSAAETIEARLDVYAQNFPETKENHND